MEQRNLGGLITSAIGLGCMGLSQGYGPADDAQSVRVIHRALDLGVSMLDTAMSYGQGHNEQLIARALHGRAGQVQIATKFGIVREPGRGARGRPARARPRLLRGVAAAPRTRRDRPVLPAPGRPGGAGGGHRGRDGRAGGRGQGPPPRALRGHPGPAGTGRGGAPDQRGGVRVVAAVARPGGRRGAGGPAAGHRPGALQPARPRPAHRRSRRAATSTPATSAATTRAFTARPWTATSGRSRRCATWPPGWGSRRASSPWRGCSPRARTSSPSPAAAARTGSRRMPPRRESG